MIIKNILLFVGALFVSSMIPETPIVSEIICNNESSNALNVKILKEGQIDFGYSIWMNPKTVKANYIIDSGGHKNVYERYASWKNKFPVLFSTSCNYTNDKYLKPVGLTIDNGNIINKQISSEMDGLVVSVNGSLTVFDVKKKFQLPGIKAALSLSVNKTEFTKWAELHKASVFQNHLLIYKNRFDVSPVKKAKPSKRKFLAILYDEDGAKHQVLFYIQKQNSLYKSAKKIFDYLQSKNMYVYSMINLDTGSNDILDLDASLNQCNGKVVTGSVEINKATNLLIFYDYR